MELHLTEWSDKVSGIARQSAGERKFNKKEVLPVTSDLIKLKEYHNTEIEKRSNELETSPSLTKWRELAVVVLASLILFNKRRGEEPAKMQVQKFQERPDWREANSELTSSLKPIERTLMKRMDLVEVIGKQNKKVPVLVTPVAKKGILCLIKHRSAVEVNSENKYMFATNSADGHLHGYYCLKKTAVEAKLDHPERVNSTLLRKYMATVSQVVGMTKQELQELGRHMGHELSVHRRFYRLQEDVIEIAKVSKLLLAAESGRAHEFAGQTLDDINLEDLPGFEETHATVSTTSAAEKVQANGENLTASGPGAELDIADVQHKEGDPDDDLDDPEFDPADSTDSGSED